MTVGLPRYLVQVHALAGEWRTVKACWQCSEAEEWCEFYWLGSYNDQWRVVERVIDRDGKERILSTICEFER